MNTNLCDSIKAQLKTGEGEAISRSELAAFLNEDERIVRKAIEQLRRSGTVVCSSRYGYFYPENAAELTAYIRREESRARQTDSVLNSARALLKEMTARSGSFV